MALDNRRAPSTASPVPGPRKPTSLDTLATEQNRERAAEQQGLEERIEALEDQVAQLMIAYTGL